MTMMMEEPAVVREPDDDEERLESPRPGRG